MKEPPRTIGQSLLRMCERVPDRPALRFPETDTGATFSQWWDRSARLAGGLSRLGVGRGDHVALLAENRVEWPIAHAAVALLGAVLVPLNTHYRRDDLRGAMSVSGAATLITSARFRSNDYLAHVEALRADLESLSHVVSLDGSASGAIDFEELLNAPPVEAPAAIDPRAPGSLQFTSGTTGVPKGAVLSHEGMLLNALRTAERLRLGPDDRWTSMIPLFHCAGCIMNLLGTLQTGGCYVGISHFDPLLLFKTIERERCTVLSGVPTAYVAMLDHPERIRFDLTSLRAGTCGGADADPAVLERCVESFPVPGLVQVYGQTESSTLLTCPAVDDPHRLDTAGPALEDYELRITHPTTGSVLANGEIGQIEGRGPMVMLGYHQRDADTTRTVSDEGWLRTGDLGYLREDARLVIAGGRLRDLVIRGGENIYPVEIENHLRQHHAVDEVAVFGLPDPYYGEIVAAAIRPCGEIAPGALIAHCEGAIARFKIPARWFRVDGFPMTSSGKIRKVELRRLAPLGSLDPL